MNTRRVRPINTGCLLLWGTWSHPYQGSVLLCFKFVVRFMDFWDFIPLPPKNIRMKSYCESSPLGYHFHSRRQQMLPDPDFIPFNTINAEKLPLLSLNIYEVELWKSVVKLRHFKTYILCYSSFTNIYEQVIASCAETLFLKDPWWNNFINDIINKLSIDRIFRHR